MPIGMVGGLTMNESTGQAAAFAGFIDLAAEKLGGRVMEANDEFFAAKENLLKPGRGVFLPDKYTDRGKWMDGWETRRRRTSGHDWCEVQLAFPGVIHGIDVDTNHFLGNAPSYASIDAKSGDAGEWVELVPKTALMPGSQNLFSVANRNVWTHLRLNIYPDGGVARMRVYGEVSVDWTQMDPDAVIDLASLTNGGRAVGCSDMFFSPMNNLIQPSQPVNMGDGWETRRRRGMGYDWVLIELARPGMIDRLEIDTAFFKGNYPDQCSVDACLSPDESIDILSWPDVEWRQVLPKTKLGPDQNHVFAGELQNQGPFTHIKLNIFPDGGVSRFRVIGKVAHGV